MKNIIIAILVIVIIGFGVYFLASGPTQNVTQNQPTAENINLPAKDQTQNQPQATSTNQEVIGKSVQGRDITAYHFGNGNKEIVFIGGVHGGYEWNTVLVAQQLVDYLKSNPKAIPTNEKITVIPVLNPDGLNKVTGTSDGNFTAADVSSNTVAGRFNANNVDLNRNFDCDWKSTGVWQNKTVSGGSKVFSEPESQAIKNYIEANNPTAIVAYYSSAGGVYASSCGDGVSSATKNLMNIYSNASGYSAHDNFDAYSVTGDMVNWFANKYIPAISVLLTDHTSTEWSKNLKGINAVLNYYSK